MFRKKHNDFEWSYYRLRWRISFFKRRALPRVKYDRSDIDLVKTQSDEILRLHNPKCTLMPLFWPYQIVQVKKLIYIKHEGVEWDYGFHWIDVGYKESVAG